MGTDNASVICENGILKVVLPLTRPTGKIRVKRRSFFGEYGVPVATRSMVVGLKHYVEWQIGYDLPANKENRAKTCLFDWTFDNYRGERKYVYELSEILYHSLRLELIDRKQVESVIAQIESVKPSATLEMREDMAICRTNPVPVKIESMDFYRMTVKYPLLVHKFDRYDICTEITIKEKQKAVGTQPMLYVCLPITSLHFSREAIGRTLDVKETADWIVGKEEAKLALELFRNFGLLSQKHRFDVCAILNLVCKAAFA